jgi:hypothetical protein
MTDESVTVKGSPVRSLQKFFDTDLSPEQRETVFRSLPAEYERLRQPILATQTVPVHMLNRLTEEAAYSPHRRSSRRRPKCGARSTTAAT